MKVRPFILLSQQDLHALEVKLAEAVEQWRSHTVPPRFVARMGTVSTALDDAQIQSINKMFVRRVVTRQGGQCLLGITPGMFQAFCLMLIDRELAVAINLVASRSILFSAAEEVLSDLAIRLLGGCPDDQYVVEKDGGGLLQELNERGSGHIHFNFELEQIRFFIALTHEAVTALRTNKPRHTSSSVNLSSRKEAIGRATTRLNVELGEIELNLGSWVSLQVGDVIKTEHSVRDPMVVRFQGAAAELTGYLGARDGKRAISVTAARNTCI